MQKHLEFFLFLGSTYTYFSVRSIMIEQNKRPFVGKPVKLSYMWRDLERRAERHGIPFSSIPTYPNALGSTNQDWRNA